MKFVGRHVLSVTINQSLKADNETLYLHLTRTGTHSDLLEK
jgi:hypothetical protein